MNCPACTTELIPEYTTRRNQRVATTDRHGNPIGYCPACDVCRPMTPRDTTPSRKDYAAGDAR